MMAAGASSTTAEDLRLPPNADVRLPAGSCAVVLDTPASFIMLALGSIGDIMQLYAGVYICIYIYIL